MRDQPLSREQQAARKAALLLRISVSQPRGGYKTHLRLDRSWIALCGYMPQPGEHNHGMRDRTGWYLKEGLWDCRQCLAKLRKRLQQEGIEDEPCLSINSLL